MLISEMSAQTLAGGEIYYELIAAKKYRVTAHIYRMCDKAPLNSLSANVYGGSYIIPMNFKRIAIGKINDTCGNPCNKQNAGSNAGFEKHTFIDTVDFNATPYDVFVKNNVCIVNFGIRQAARPSTLTTLVSGIFYLDASTDICLSNITENSSPQFSMEPKFLAGCNLPLSYSPGPLDTMDNDSFSFSLVDVQEDYNTNVMYKGSFTSQLPMSPFCLPPGVITCKPLPNAKPPRGFYFDKATCQTVFTPSGCSDKGIIKYRIDEYRYNVQTKHYDWLGFVTREMFMQIVSGVSNNSPQIIGKSAYALCAGDKLCFTVKATDLKSTGQSTADTTTLFWDEGIKDATFSLKDSSVREKEGEFCWQTKITNKREETGFFTTAAFDKICNISLATTTDRIMVNPKLKYDYKNTIGACGLVKWTASVADTFYPNIGFSNKTVIRLFSTNQILYTGFGLMDSTNIHENGKIIIEHTFNATCPVTVQDTFTINGALIQPDINDNSNQVVCKNVSVPFDFKASRVIGLKTFKWFLDDSLINQTDTSISLALLKNSTIKLQIENNGGCFAERSLLYAIKKHNAITSYNATYCPGNMATVVSDITSLKRPVNYYWKINGIDTAVNDSNLAFQINRDSKIVLTMKDAGQCVFMDSVSYSTWPAVKFGLNYEHTVCKDSLTITKATNVVAVNPYTYNWRIDRKTIVNNDSILLFNAANNFEVSLDIKDKNGCSFKDSAFIQTIKTPEVTLMSALQSCVNSDIVIVPVINNRPSVVNYQWRLNKAIIGTDSVLKRKVTANELLILKVSNTQNCVTEDSVNIVTYPVTPVSIVGKKNYHPSSFIMLGTNNAYKTYLWFDGKTDATDSFWASDLGPPGKYVVWCKTIDNNGCQYYDTVEINTDQFLSVSRDRQLTLQIYPNPVKGIMTIESFDNSDISLFSVEGRLIAVYKLLQGKNAIDLSSQAKGIYFLQATINGEQKIYKIIKE